jgi:hypothetical protein
MTTYSFNDILYSEWTLVAGKKYVRIDTGEVYGEIFCKYPKESGKLSALFCEGIIEFVARSTNATTNKKEIITKICGTDMENMDAKIFSVQG